MNVLVDTSVWSLALRRRTGHVSPHAVVLREIIAEGRAVLLGVVRQEVLSGIRHPEQHTRLKQHLRAFPDVSLEIEDYELAAQIFNTCMKKGIAGGPVDFLICATAHRRRYKIFTADPDIERLARHVAIDLLEPLK
ncbi:MAG: type II toxin-antitoxin system VapC family toxin [Verrucomicrobiales bacterium]